MYQWQCRIPVLLIDTFQRSYISDEAIYIILSMFIFDKPYWSRILSSILCTLDGTESVSTDWVILGSIVNQTAVSVKNFIACSISIGKFGNVIIYIGAPAALQATMPYVEITRWWLIRLVWGNYVYSDVWIYTCFWQNWVSNCRKQRNTNEL